MMVRFDDADHFAACLHPLLSALVMLTSKVQLIQLSFTTYSWSSVIKVLLSMILHARISKLGS